MGGGLLQLVAYGAQDAYLSGNPHITFWKILYKRHTNFAMEAFRINFTGAPAWGQRLVAPVPRNADLMYKTYLEVVLPNTSGVNVAWTSAPSRRLGYQILKKIEVEIGGQIVDTHYGEWLFLWENLTSDYDNSVKLDSMVGGNLGGAITTNNSCGGRPGVLHGNRTYLLMDADGQIAEAHSISAGLDYPGIGPEHAWLHDTGRVTYLSTTDSEALEAFQLLSKLEGIIPALEPAHAIARAVEIAASKPKDHLMIVNLCGRGDKDIFSVAEHLGGME
jgi:hypothetical protein